MDPITILYLVGAALTGATIVYIAYLAISAVRNYLRHRRTEKSSKEAAFIIKKQMESGNVRVIAGFFDGKSVTESKTWEAKSVDSEIQNLDDGDAYILT